MNDIPVEEVVNVMLDIHVNPLGQILVQLMAGLVQKGVISKDEARFYVASAVKVINATDQPEELREQGARELQRMLEALNTLPD